MKKGPGEKLIYKDYSHKKDRKFRSKQDWRCVPPGCLGRFHTVNEVDSLTATVVHFNPHDHIANSVAVISNETKAKLYELVIQEEIQHLPLK